MSEPTDDFEYERRFFCRELPAEYDDGDAPTLIIQSYYVACRQLRLARAAGLAQGSRRHDAPA